MPVPKHPSDSPLRIALRGARENLVPGLVLQAFALALAIAYYRSLHVHGLVDRYAALRSQWGVLLPMLTTSLFGCVIPYLYLLLRGGVHGRNQTPVRGLILLAYWFYKGWEVDFLYRGLALIFGEGHDARTIVSKMLVDQFIYCVFFAVPVTWVLYAWLNVDRSWRRLRTEVFVPGWFTRGIFPLLISVWGVWCPAVLIIYTLPTALQLPMQNLVLCFFTLLVETLSLRRHHQHPSPNLHPPETEMAEELL